MIHLHDMGRYCCPYEDSLHTPNIQKFSEKATVFTNAFSAAPTCSPSRAALLTGENAHSSGMTGLLHRGDFRLKDPSRHLGSYLQKQGYETAYAGVQHEFDPNHETIPYERNLTPDSTNGIERDKIASQAAAQYLEEPKEKPFFLFLGLFYPHRPFLESSKYNYPMGRPSIPAFLPKSPEIQTDIENYATTLAYADDCLGEIFQKIYELNLFKDTIIILTTDHGIAFPGMKCTLSDSGIGVALMTHFPSLENAPDTFDKLTSHLDLFPSLCDVLKLPYPDWLEGHSFIPAIKQPETKVRDEIFAEINFHASYEPSRCIRTKDYKLIEHFNPRNKILCNIDASPTKDLLLKKGLSHEQEKPRFEWYNLKNDPDEINNLAEDPNNLNSPIFIDLKIRLKNWMRQTKDPLLEGPVPIPSNSRLNRINAIDASEPELFSSH